MARTRMVVLLAPTCLVVTSACDSGARNDDPPPPAGTPPVACVRDADCPAPDLGPCLVATCDPASNTCTTREVAAGTPCWSGDPCRVGETCGMGVCDGGMVAPAACAEGACGSDACGNVCGCEGDASCNAQGRCCEDECELGATRCGDGELSRCEVSDTGCSVWVGEGRCASGFCADAWSCGECNHGCGAVGQVSCANGAFRVCEEDRDGCRAWSAPSACASGRCEDGSSCDGCPPAECAASGLAECVGGAVRHCTANASGCRAWSEPTACESGRCADGSSCFACQDRCSAGATRCTDGALRTCEADADGCLDWSSARECAHGFCADATTCGACDDACVVGTAMCSDAGSLVSCLPDALCGGRWGPSSDCDGRCADGQCVCDAIAGPALPASHTAGRIGALARSADHLFVAVEVSWAWRMQIYRGHGALTHVAELPLDRSVKRLVVAGNRVYLLSSTELAIVDVTDPASPALVSRLSLEPDARLLAVAGDLAVFVQTFTLNIVTGLASDAPTIVWSQRLGWSPNWIELVGRHLYVAGDDGLYLYEVNVPSAPALVQALPGAFEAFDVHGDLLVAGGDQTIARYRIAADGRLSADGAWDAPNPVRSLRLGERFAVIGTDDGLFPYADPAGAFTPRIGLVVERRYCSYQASSCDHFGVPTSQLALDGALVTAAAVALEDGLMSDYRSPSEVVTYDLDEAPSFTAEAAFPGGADLAVHRGRIIGRADTALRVLDPSRGYGAGALVNDIAVPNETSRLFVAGDRAYLERAEAGAIDVFALTGEGSPNKIVTLAAPSVDSRERPFRYRLIGVSGTKMVLGADNARYWWDGRDHDDPGELRIYESADGRLELIASYVEPLETAEFHPRQAWLEGDRLVLVEERYIDVFVVGHGAMVRIERARNEVFGGSGVLSAGHLYIADNQLRAFDIDAIGLPATAVATGYYRDLEIVGDTLLGLTSSRLEAFDLADPSHPRLVSSIALPQEAIEIVAHGGTIMIRHASGSLTVVALCAP